MPPRRNKPKVPIYVIDEEFTNMDSATLKNNLAIYRERFADTKSRRNYIQMDRDMVQSFYDNTQKEIENIRIQIINKETDTQKLEEQHQMEIRVFLHKQKQLEYDQEKSNKEIEVDGEKAKNEEINYFNTRLLDMTKDKIKLKGNYVENEKTNIISVQKTEENHDKIFLIQEKEFDIKANQLIEKYETRLAKLQEELQLKLKVEIHELEERKNLHINELINNHEKAFAELKKYYNDITAENLNLIKSQKQEIAKINANLNTNTKLINNMKSQNAALKEPLEEKTRKRNELKNDLKQFEKNKMSLSNLKCKLIVLKEKIAKLKTDSEDLNQKYEKV